MELTREQNENWIVNALEGGSNYWYLIGVDGLNAIRDVVSRETDPYFSTALHKAVFDHDVIVPIRDVEDEETILGYLSKESITRGLELCKNNNPKFIGQILSGGDDAETADVIFQYCLLGEIVYG